MKKRVIAVLLALCLIVGGESTRNLQAAVVEASAEKETIETVQEQTEETEEAVAEDAAEEMPEEEAVESKEAEQISDEKAALQEASPEVSEESKTDVTEGEEPGEIEKSEEELQESEEIASKKEAGEELLEQLENSEDALVEKLTEAELQEAVRGAGTYDEKEPNNSAAEANTVSLGTTVRGSITDNDAVDFYKVTLPAAGKLTLKIHSKLQCYSVALHEAKLLTDPENEDYYVHSSGNWWNSALKEITNTHNFYLEGGTYYIQIVGCSYINNRVDYTGDYTCGFTYKKSDLTETEPNNSIDTAENLTYGKVVKGQISWWNDSDYYKINVNKPGKVTLAATAWISRYSICLYTKDETEIWHAGDIEWDGKKSVNTWDIYLESGTYYVGVRKAYNGGRGLYQIKATYKDSKTTFTGSDNSASEAKKISYNKNYTGQMSVNDNLDIYKFTVSSSRNVPLSIISYMKYYTAKIYNASGTEVWNSGICGKEDGKEKRKDEYVITLGRGTYYLEITGYAYYGNYTGIYKFNFSAGSLSSLKLNKKNVKLTRGSSYKLKAVMSPEAVKVSWKSSDPKVVYVKSGKITAKGYGTATITCTAKDGSNKKASCKITVVPAKAQIASVKSVKSGKKLMIKSQNGVTGFEVYTKEKRGSWKLYKIVKGAKNKSITVKNSYYNTHSFKVRAYKQVGTKKYYGAFSKVL